LSKEFPDNVASLFRSGIDVSRKAANGIWNSFQVCDVECWLSSLQPSARTQAEKLLERHRLRLQPYLQGNVSLTDWPPGYQSQVAQGLSDADGASATGEPMGRSLCDIWTELESVRRRTRSRGRKRPKSPSPAFGWPHAINIV